MVLCLSGQSHGIKQSILPKLLKCLRTKCSENMFVAARFSSNLAIYRLYFLQMKTVLVENLY